MLIPLVQYEWCGYRVKGVRPNLVIPLRPEPDWPTGRKGLRTADAWGQLRADGSAGLLLMDNDVAADPDDLAVMVAAVAADPAVIHAGMVKGWPVSTGRPEWCWSHRSGTLGAPVAHQDESAPVAYVSTCFTWFPGQLLDLAQPLMPAWRWEQVDVGLSELALAHAISARTVPGCRPKHLHC